MQLLSLVHHFMTHTNFHHIFGHHHWTATIYLLYFMWFFYLCDIIFATLVVVKSKHTIVNCDDFICVITKEKKITLNEIILLQEYLPKPTLTTGIVFKIELIKAVKCTLVSVNVQKVNVEIVAVKRNLKTRLIMKFISNKFQSQLYQQLKL